jgi:hypothetical protein
MTFFYPSTEWDMAQPFTCCGSSNCWVVKGAAHIRPEILVLISTDSQQQLMIVQTRKKELRKVAMLPPTLSEVKDLDTVSSGIRRPQPAILLRLHAKPAEYKRLDELG